MRGEVVRFITDITGKFLTPLTSIVNWQKSSFLARSGNSIDLQFENNALIWLFDLIHITCFSPQDAGKYLRELQKSLKNPAANLGLVVSEGLKRSKRYMCIQEISI